MGCPSDTRDDEHWLGKAPRATTNIGWARRRARRRLSKALRATTNVGCRARRRTLAGQGAAREDGWARRRARRWLGKAPRATTNIGWARRRARRTLAGLGKAPRATTDVGGAGRSAARDDGSCQGRPSPVGWTTLPAPGRRRARRRPLPRLAKATSNDAAGQVTACYVRWGTGCTRLFKNVITSSLLRTGAPSRRTNLSARKPQRPSIMFSQI